MTSKIKVDNINKVSDDTNIIKKCGSTTTVGSGSGNTIVVCGSTVTMGRCGGTVALASGASQTGFGRSGSVNWQTTPKTATFTAADGEGYFVNSGSALTMNLPAGSAGAIVAVSDYARNFATYNLTIAPNGSELIGGQSGDATLNVNGQAATFVYVDGTKGWVNVQNAEDTETGEPPYIEATGGTITCSGNDRIHTFTGPGTFTVTKIATVCAPVNNLVSYMVVAGGAGGGGTGPSHVGGGGGAGGIRETKSPATPYTASPLDGYPTPGNRITVTAQGYAVVVGGGGIKGTEPTAGGNGNPSSIFGITSSGGGGGGSIGTPGSPAQRNGQAGGSGGGGSSQTAGPGGAGNTPSVTPAQGTAGAQGVDSPPDLRGGGGGGATVAGCNGANPGPSPAFVQGTGGAGATSCISGSPVTRGGGGGSGASYLTPNPGLPGAGGAGGGGAGGSAPGVASRLGNAGTDNTGGGGGGAAGGAPPLGEGGARCGGLGGSGVVIIRYRAR